jgi:hypothetical protein
MRAAKKGFSPAAKRCETYERLANTASDSSGHHATRFPSYPRFEESGAQEGTSRLCAVGTLHQSPAALRKSCLSSAVRLKPIRQKFPTKRRAVSSRLVSSRVVSRDDGEARGEKPPSCNTANSTTEYLVQYSFSSYCTIVLLYCLETRD